MKKNILISLAFIPIISYAQITSVPDVKFEQILIAEGIDSDGIINGQILTSDAQNVTKLELGSSSINPGQIQNLKGIEAFINLENLEGQFNGINNAMDLSSLTKLKTLNFPSNAITKLDLSNNINLEELIIANHEPEFWQLNYLPKLDLSNNTKVNFINAYNLTELKKINMRNNKASSVFINLGNEFNLPYNVCIEVDDPIKATNKQVPYDNWSIQGDHYFDSACTLSVEKFVKENFKVYPNPTSEYVVIEQKDTENVQLESVQIIDSKGKWIRTVKDNFNNINVSNLTSGTYLFVIQTNKGNKVDKIIIN